VEVRLCSRCEREGCWWRGCRCSLMERRTVRNKEDKKDNEDNEDNEDKEDQLVRFPRKRRAAEDRVAREG
jgi:hypothetical protein